MSASLRDIPARNHRKKYLDVSESDMVYLYKTVTDTEYPKKGYIKEQQF